MSGAVASEPTEELLRRIRGGDASAKHTLYERCLPLLRRWAHGRLPLYARDIADTDDLVQVTLMRALNHVSEFEAERSGCFLAYLRQILLNEVRAEMRKRRTRGSTVDIEELALPDEAASVVEQLVGEERMRSYETALGSLEREQQALVVMRFEFGMSYQEIALENGATPDGVRMRVARALKILAERMVATQDRA